MTAALPAVSVMCLTYGRPHLLEEAIYSFLHQDYAGPKEMIVLNDCAEQTLVFAHPDVKIINVPQRFRTLGEKRNACAALASHDILFPWDDDDIHLPHRLSLSLTHLDLARGYFKPDQALRLHNGAIAGPEVNWWHGCACFTRELFVKVGGYPAMGPGEDAAFEQAVGKLLGAKRAYPITDLTAIAYLYRWGGTGSYHASWFIRDKAHATAANDKVAAYVKRGMERGQIRTGLIQLAPQWRSDYRALVTAYLQQLTGAGGSTRPTPGRKIFGIGLPRTGTTSVALALLELGFKTCHVCLDRSIFARGEAFLDTPVWAEYPLLDKSYPGAKFILTWREPSRWYASFAQTLAAYLGELRQTTPKGDCGLSPMDRDCYLRVFGTAADTSREFLIACYEQHRRQVEDYFRDRPADLLILDLEAPGDPWAELCRFLERPRPATPFPRLNAGRQTLDWDKVEHVNKITYMDNRWLAWTRGNLQSGCAPETILAILVKQKFALSAIRAAMGAKFPENSPLLSQGGPAGGRQDKAVGQDLPADTPPPEAVNASVAPRLRAAAAPPRIFVQIASYRDPECQWTVRDLFAKAANPDRLFVGICWQGIPEKDTPCFAIQTRPEQVRTIKVHAQESLGVCWARQQTQSLWQGEEYTLQIDSHMRFVPGWDATLIEELHKCPAAKPLLSCDPPSYKPPDNLHPNPKLTVKVAYPFQPNGEMRFGGRELSVPPKKPLQGAFVAAGFMFASAQVIREVPYDPYLYFGQEEAVYAARLYTHGWDVFTPTQLTVYHYYNPPKKSVRPLHWADNKVWGKLQKRGLQRYQYLLGHKDVDDPAFLIDIDHYGLGTARTLEAYGEFCGINYKTGEVTEKALKGRFMEKGKKGKRENPG